MEARHFSVRDMPELGSKHPCPRCGRKTLIRVLSRPTIADAKLRFDGKYPYLSRRHQGLAGCRENADGHPIIESKAHEREVAAMNGLVRE